MRPILFGLPAVFLVMATVAPSTATIPASGTVISKAPTFSPTTIRGYAGSSAVFDPRPTATCPSGCAYIFGGEVGPLGYAIYSNQILRYDVFRNTVTAPCTLPPAAA